MKMLQTQPYNIILNIDHIKDANVVPLYKVYGSYYESNVLNKRETIVIHPNVHMSLIVIISKTY